MEIKMIRVAKSPASLRVPGPLLVAMEALEVGGEVMAEGRAVGYFDHLRDRFPGKSFKFRTHTGGVKITRVA